MLKQNVFSTSVTSFECCGTLEATPSEEYVQGKGLEGRSQGELLRVTSLSSLGKRRLRDNTLAPFYSFQKQGNGEEELSSSPAYPGIGVVFKDASGHGQD